MSTPRGPAMAARLAAVLVVAVLAAGCDPGAGEVATPGETTGGTVSTPAEPPPGGSAPPGSSAAEPPVAPPTAGGTPSPSPEVTVARTPSPSAEVTRTGVVVEGVEANCLLLDAPEGTYLLVTRAGVDRSPIRAGARITVRGNVEPELLSTCQQGIPFLVSEVRPE